MWKPEYAPAVALLLFIMLVFLIGRELVCWYWKINKTVNSLDEILSELKKINERNKI